MKPSKALLELYHDECRQKCNAYKWVFKPPFVHTYCVRDCVRETIKKERPLQKKGPGGLATRVPLR